MVLVRKSAKVHHQTERVSRSRGRATGRHAFTFIELLVAMIFLSLSLLSLLWMSRYSNRESMDAYYELVSFSLAREPLEVFRTFGYEWVTTYQNHQIARYPLGRKIIEPRTTPDQYPFDSELFEREITIAPDDTVTDGIRARKVTVKVSPVKESRVEAWLSRDEVRMETLIFEGPRM